MCVCVCVCVCVRARAREFVYVCGVFFGCVLCSISSKPEVKSSFIIFDFEGNICLFLYYGIFGVGELKIGFKENSLSECP